MFAIAYELVSKFTHPVLISIRYFDGTVESGLGSFVILNNEGWVLTAAHILDPAITGQKHSVELKKYQDEVDKISADPNLNSDRKSTRLNSSHIQKSRMPSSA